MTAARHLIIPSPQVGVAAVEDWRNHAVCRDMASRTWDPWFPEFGAGSDNRDTRRAAYEDARTMCHHCPVQAECLADAIATGERDGMRGGLDPVERKTLSRPAGWAPVPIGAAVAVAKEHARQMLREGSSAYGAAKMTGLSEGTVGRLAVALREVAS